MEIRDPVHGSIRVYDEEIPIVENKFFQRLRNIKQLGFLEYAFPGATHTRFLHSLGVMDVSSKAFDALFSGDGNSRDKLRLKETLRLAALLHDIGHAPLSHSTEIVMPQLSELKLPSRFATDSDVGRKATHEDYTIKSIVDSSYAKAFTEVERAYGVDRNCVAELIKGETSDPDYFLYNGLNYFPMLHQLISSEMDCDRMDYLLRDSYFCGVSYGSFDLDWIITNLIPCSINGSVYLGISEKAVSTFDDFLLSRFHMFTMVYFHYRSVCMEQMLYRYFDSEECSYKIPADVEDYQNHDDHHLMKVLRASDNMWAKKIVKNVIPDKIFEIFGESQSDRLAKVEHYLSSNQIDYIRCSSKGRLSKYCINSTYESKYPIQMVRKYFGSNKESYINIVEATDLFQKFSCAHSINRIHCDLQEQTECQISEIYNIIQE